MAEQDTTRNLVDQAKGGDRSAFEELIGDELWAVTFEELSGSLSGNHAEQTADGGYVLAGSVKSKVRGVSTRNGRLVKTDSEGFEERHRDFGFSERDLLVSVQQLSDSGYVVGGLTRPEGGGQEGDDVLLLKTDRDGVLLWTKTFGGDGADTLHSVRETTDGGFVISGWTRSFAVSTEVYLLKTDWSGELEWEKTFAGDEKAAAWSAQQTIDGGYIVVGGQDRDLLVFKTDPTGDLLWKRTFGGPDGDLGLSVEQTSDEGYIVAGYRDLVLEVNPEAGVYLIKIAPGDSDGDGIAGGQDNCPNDPNPLQEDSDGDGVGDACDACPGFDDHFDADGDGVPDACDACPGDADNDIDGDGICGDVDNCPGAANTDQVDSDADGVGDSCDQCPGADDAVDTDGDGKPNVCDNCPDDSKPGQEDDDADGIGDAYEDCEKKNQPCSLDSECCSGNCRNNGRCAGGSGGGGSLEDRQFVRGDSNSDGQPDVSDAVFSLSYLFAGADAPSCLDAADANDDGTVDISDITYTLSALFNGAATIPPPYPERGLDTTEDELGCQR